MKSFGSIIWKASGFAMLFFEVYWFYVWWGILGALGGLLFLPLALIFPFIYLFKEGFSITYFGIWALGIIGIIISGENNSEESPRDEILNRTSLIKQIPRSNNINYCSNCGRKTKEDETYCPVCGNKL